MNKYRIKLNQNRIVGPLSAKDVFQLFEKGQISGSEQFQLFPSGDWKDIDAFPELINILSQDKSKTEITTDQTVANLKLRAQATKKKEEDNRKAKVEKVAKLDEEIKKKDFVEFKFDRDKYEEPTIELPIEEIKEEKSDEIKSEESSNVEKTRVIKAPKINEDVEKTRVVRVNEFRNKPVAKAEDSKEELAKVEKAEEAEEAEEEVDEQVSTDEATRVTSLTSLLPQLHEEAQLAESQLVGVEEVEKPQPKSKKAKKEKEEPKRKIKPIVALSIGLLVFYLLFMEPSSPSKEPKYFLIQSPITREVESAESAANALKKGLELYRKNDYISKVLAAQQFKESVEYKFSDNEALGHLILVYSELLPNVKNLAEARQVIFKLVQITQSKRYKVPEIALGTALFFKNSDKNQTAIRVIENYLRLSKPTIKLMALYLDLLVEVGRLEEARKLVEKIAEVPNKPVEVIASVSKFYMLNEEKEKAASFLREGLKSNPNSVFLLIEYADYLWDKKDFGGYKDILKKVELLNSEGSPYLFSMFLERMGLLSVLNKDSKTAAVLFSQALKIRESDRLRSKLAELEIGGSKLEENLIIESKIIELINKAKEAESNLNWDLAFKYAIEAADLTDSYIPSKLYLSELQIRRGFFESAIDTLNKLKKLYPTNIKVNFHLIKAYIESFKLNEADKEILVIKNLPAINETREFASLLGRFYLKSANILNAIKWLQESIRRDPLSSEDYFLLAETYLRYRKYDQAKYQLTKAMELDPQNLDYLTAYSKILYELDGAELAIGYLRNYLEDFPDEARILGEIAIYHYKNGQIKEFELIKGEVEKLNRKDPGFYQFLVDAAKLEDNVDQVVNYSKKLLEVAPGDLEAAIVLGIYLEKQRKYEEALEAYFSVVKRLKGYPKINYFIGKLYLNIGQIDKALEYSKYEIDQNPALYNGYYLAGETFRRKELYPDAIKMLEKAISIDGKSVEALLSLSDIKLNQGYHEAAREMCIRAVRMEPNNPKVRRLLGFIYLKIGQSSLAADEFNTYLKLDPAASDRDKIEQHLRLINR